MSPTPARNAMVEKVQRILFGDGVDAVPPEGMNDKIYVGHSHVRDVIAAVFDNLPREVMARAMNGPPGPDRRRALVDAIISAGRREVLGHE